MGWVWITFYITFLHYAFCLLFTFTYIGASFFYVSFFYPGSRLNTWTFLIPTLSSYISYTFPLIGVFCDGLYGKKATYPIS
ncbi:hypothetical protein EV426DRAFT_133061 [Tirmania nivea]|nr:hypothetical protein EV426DRAFT_133061 [Tirmania nivea]